jgi:hypothetical protein
LRGNIVFDVVRPSGLEKGAREIMQHWEPVVRFRTAPEKNED